MVNLEEHAFVDAVPSAFCQLRETGTRRTQIAASPNRRVACVSLPRLGENQGNVAATIRTHLG